MANSKWDAIWINANLITCENGYGLLEKAAIATHQGKIVWLGKETDLHDKPEKLAATVNNVNGACITPGLIDCHTHLVYGGNRVNEFVLRLNGVSYTDIAKQGGGIQSTVSATRAISEEELFNVSLVRAQNLIASGVTTLEIKSGYGLDLETELKMLRVAQRIGKTLSISVATTFLGAHTVPKEYKNNPDQYVDHVCNDMMPIIAKEKLAEAVDVFCESIAFNLQQTERIFATAKNLNLQIKCHAEQLSDSGCAALAAQYHAISADHLEHLSPSGVKALSKSKTVAVLLPGAFYFLRETKLPPIESLREHHVPIAIASDCNPGTSPIMSLLVIMNMACTLFRLTPEEALLGVTKHAAQALGRENSQGTLVVGKEANLAIWDIKHPAELIYYVGSHPLCQLIYRGKNITF